MNKLFSFFFLLLSFSVQAQVFPISSHTKVSLITCGSGEEMYALFGHSALRFCDTTYNYDVVFNYGEFDFNTPNFYLKFVRGNLKYKLGMTNFSNFLSSYKYENRSVFEQILNISTDEKQLLMNKLLHTLSTDEKYYEYKFLEKNCTTVLLDVIRGLSDKIHISPVNQDKTYREIICSYLEDSFATNLILNIPLGYRLDRKIKSDHICMPQDLKTALSTAKYDGKEMLVSKSLWLYKPPSKVVNNSLMIPILILSIVLLLIFFVEKSAIVFSFTYGLLGFMLLMISLYSSHSETHFNYHILLFNPIFLILPFISSIRYKFYFRVVTYISILFFLLISICKPHFIVTVFLFVPILMISIKYILKFNKTFL